MNSFAKGIILAMAFTTSEGRAITEKVGRVGIKIGDKVLKNKLGIDIRAILAEEETEQKIEEEPKEENEDA